MEVDYTGLIEDLEYLADWADENIYEVPIHLPGTLRVASRAIKDLNDKYIKSEIDATNYYGALIQANAELANAELKKYIEAVENGLS